MSRLTKAKKAAIIKAVNEKQFEPQIKAILRDERLLVDRLYAELYPKEVLDWMGKNPSERHAFTTNNHFTVNQITEDGSEQWWFCKGRSRAYMTCSRQFLAADAHSLVVLPGNHWFFKAQKDVKNQYDEARRTADKAKATLRAALDSITTVKRLLDTYPELEPFIPPEEKLMQLPAIQRDVVAAIVGGAS